jgi:hypothetical protein
VEDTVSETRRAYDALLRSQSQILAQRDALEVQLARIGAAIDALRELIGPSPDPPAAAQVDKVDDDTNGSVPGRSAESAVETAKPVNRKTRIREITLESPDEWFSAADMAQRVENRVPSETRRTATYEMMRRMAKQGELELDNSAKPTKFRGRPAAIRERLLVEGE